MCHVTKVYISPIQKKVIWDRQVKRGRGDFTPINISHESVVMDKVMLNSQKHTKTNINETIQKDIRLHLELGNDSANYPCLAAIKTCVHWDLFDHVKLSAKPFLGIQTGWVK